MSGNTAAILKEAKAQIIVEQRPTPTPRAGEILVKNAAVAINPVDWKIQDYTLFVTDYPNVLGSDIAGVVEVVGSDVKRFKEGDRVFGYAGVIASNNIDEGAFQQYSILRQHCAAHLPQNISFEEGSTLPMAVTTAAWGIWKGMGLPKPSQGKQSGGFLVWGASSSVGATVVQIAVSLGYTVFGVCSSHNHEDVKRLGCANVFDYKTKNVVQDIVVRAESERTPIGVVYDAISEHGSAPQCAEVLEAFGGGKLCLTLPWPQDATRPDKVELSEVAALTIVEKDVDLGAFIFHDWVQGVLKDGSFKIYPIVQAVEGGIKSIQNAFEVQKKGVSGKKVVVPL